MDKSDLVSKQLEDGGKLVEALARSGFPVLAAFWARKNDSERWYLYLVTPLVKKGPLEAYKEADAILRKFPEPLWVELLELKLIGPKEPLAKAVLHLLKYHLGKIPGRFPGSQLGWQNIEEGYVYAPVAAVVQDK